MRKEDRKIPKIILLVESSRATGRALLCGIARYAHDHGPWSFNWEPRGLEQSWPRLRNAEADGVIVRDIENMDAVLSRAVPTVIVGHQRQELPNQVNVVTDSEMIGQLAADHLLSCGFRNFAFCGFEGSPWSEQRCESFSKRVLKAGFSVDSFLVSNSKPGGRNSRKPLQSWLKKLNRPLGLMPCNDELGLMILETCHQAGLRVPDDVAVIGADNDDVVCGLADPPLSSIAINFECAGYESARVLDSLMRGDKLAPSRIVVAATHVVARRSTDIVAVEDSHLAKALTFIRDHSKQWISVSDVARAVGLSRRALENRFRANLNRSTQNVIRQARIDQIARLLMETNLPVAKIAEETGFEDVCHVARYFRAVKGVTPLVYRRRFLGTTVKTTEPRV
jgi:LacI family transcriptional regulator